MIEAKNYMYNLIRGTNVINSNHQLPHLATIALSALSIALPLPPRIFGHQYIIAEINSNQIMSSIMHRGSCKMTKSLDFQIFQAILNEGFP